MRMRLYVWQVPTQRYLDRLQAADFDPAAPSLHDKSYLGLQMSLLKHTIRGTFY